MKRWENWNEQNIQLREIKLGTENITEDNVEKNSHVLEWNHWLMDNSPSNKIVSMLKLIFYIFCEKNIDDKSRNWK